MTHTQDSAECSALPTGVSETSEPNSERARCVGECARDEKCMPSEHGIFRLQ